ICVANWVAPARPHRSSPCAQSAIGSRRSVADLGRLRPRSLRWRLTLALGSVLILAFLGTFYVVYHETDSRLRGQIDSALATEAKSFSSYISPPRDERTAAAIARAA